VPLLRAMPVAAGQWVPVSGLGFSSRELNCCFGRTCSDSYYVPKLEELGTAGKATGRQERANSLT
jgi:hypothetical protein